MRLSVVRNVERWSCFWSPLLKISTNCTDFLLILSNGLLPLSFPHPRIPFEISNAHSPSMSRTAPIDSVPVKRELAEAQQLALAPRVVPV
ncbi:hypothetical protein NG726_04855 [Pseudomonas sp. MOB-449]|nr:hypothetical protein [Pseudomonas sp. MOB-449]